MKRKSLLILMLLALMSHFAAKAQDYIYDPMPFDNNPYGWTTYNTYGTGNVAVSNGKMVFAVLTTASVSGQNVSMFGVKMCELYTEERVVKVGFTLKPNTVTTTTSQRFAFQVGYFANNSSQFTSVKTIYSNNNVFTDLHGSVIEASFTVITALPEGARIAFQMMSTTTGKIWRLDDVYVQDVIPTNPSVSNILAESADLSWESEAGITQWVVQYRPWGQGSSWNNSISTTVLANPYTITGLEANSRYDVRVAAKKGNYMSSYSDYTTFGTPFLVDREHPYTDSFNTSLVQWTYKILPPSNVNYGWNRGSEVYHENTENPNQESMYVHCGGQYSYTCFNSKTAYYAYKLFEFSELENRVRYWWQGQGYSTQDYMRVILIPNDVNIQEFTINLPDGLSYNTLPSGWIALDGGHGLNGQDDWVLQDESFVIPQTGVYQVVFFWTNLSRYGYSYTPGAVDDFILSFDACDPPVFTIGNIQEHYSDVTVYWNDSDIPADATTVSLQYKKASETQWSELVTLPTTQHYYHLTGLEGGTEYQVRMTCDCAVEFRTESFTTNCLPVFDYPYVCDFSDGIPYCMETTGTDFSILTAGGNASLCFSGNEGVTEYVALPYIPLYLHNTGNYGLMVSFNWKHSNEYPEYNDGVQVQYSFDDEDWVDVGDFIPRYNATAGWMEKNIPLTMFNNTATEEYGHIRLLFTGTGGGQCFIDDINVDLIPQCGTVSDLEKVFDGSTVTLTWTPNTFQTNWEVYTSADPTVITVTEPTVTLNDVPWGTTVWIRGNCEDVGGYGEWTEFDLTEDIEPCANVTELAVSDTYLYNNITVSWTPSDYQSEWEVVYTNNSSFDIEDVTEEQIHLVTEPQYTMENLTFESTYRAWVRGNCLLEGGYSDWEMISFKPTQFTEITLNDGDATNNMVPVNPMLTNTDDMSMSQFILPQADMEDYEGLIKGLKFYTDADDAINFTDAIFAVYMRETPSETFDSDEFADWTTMQRVYYGQLSIVQEEDDYVMDVVFTNSPYYFNYSGQGNLIIGVKQIVKGSDDTAPEFDWLGVETLGYTSIGMDNDTEITRSQFLPKIQIVEKLMDVPCPAPSNLTTSNVTHHSVTLSWVPGLDETSWMLKYNKASMDYEWTEVTVSENPYTLTGLSNNTSYDFQLRASCGGDEYSYMVTTSVTTAMGNTFITDGDWDDASNWSFNEVPTIDDEVYIEAAAVVPSGCIAEADKINVLSEGLITIADGGQMKSNNTFVAVVEKNITGYGAENVDGNSGYYFMATPIDLSVVQGNIIPQQDDEFLYDQVDLYWFNGYNEAEEWYNPKYADGSIDGRVMVSSKKGYLYARQNDGILSFGTGYQYLPATNEDISVSLTVNTGSTAPLNGWNLIGNPFTCNAYLLDNNGQVMPYYKMNDTGDAIVKVQAGTPIKPCESVLVFKPNDGSVPNAVFTTTDPGQLGDEPDDVAWLLPVHNLVGSQPAYIAPTTVTQTIGLVAGTNWVSFNVEITLDDLKAALTEASPTSVITIKSQTQKTTYNPNNGRWTGRLTTLDLSQMYKITVNEASELTLESLLVNPAEHTVTITPGANWIAYPLNTSMTPQQIFTGFAVAGDMVKSQSQKKQYNANGRWTGQLGNLEPGHGYVYNSNSTEVRTFTFPTSAE